MDQKLKLIERLWESSQNRSEIKELLQVITGNDTISEADIETLLLVRERSQILSKHKHKIWESGGLYCTYLPDPTAKRGIRIKRSRTREGLEEAIVKHYKQNEKNPTIEDVFTEWNDRRLESGKIVEATHLRNQYCFDRHFAEFGKRRIHTVCPSEFQDFLEVQIKQYNLTARGFSNLKGIVKGFLKRAKKKGLISFNVTEMVDDMDVTERSFKSTHKDDKEEVFFDDEIDRILEYIKENPTANNLAVALMFATGLRIGEIVALKHSDFKGMSVKIQRSETRYRLPDKTYKYEIQEHPKTVAGFRQVVIPDSYKWVVDKLKLCNPFGEWVFVKRDKKTRITTNTIRSRLRGICQKLGMLNRSSHKIRKTYGSILMDNNVDTKLIESQMGHTDITVTENYYHRDRKSLQQKQRIINGIEEFAK